MDRPCCAVPWAGGPRCNLAPGHAGQHEAPRAKAWTSTGPLVECSCCQTRVSPDQLDPGYRETCKSCAGSFAAFGCG